MLLLGGVGRQEGALAAEQGTGCGAVGGHELQQNRTKAGEEGRGEGSQFAANLVSYGICHGRWAQWCRNCGLHVTPVTATWLARASKAKQVQQQADAGCR